MMAAASVSMATITAGMHTANKIPVLCKSPLRNGNTSLLSQGTGGENENQANTWNFKLSYYCLFSK